MRGLAYLHNQRIIHLDIKPANVLLTRCAAPACLRAGQCGGRAGARDQQLLGQRWLLFCLTGGACTWPQAARMPAPGALVGPVGHCALMKNDLCCWHKVGVGVHGADTCSRHGRREGKAKLSDVGLAKMMQTTQISAGGVGAPQPRPAIRSH